MSTKELAIVCAGGIKGSLAVSSTDTLADVRDQIHDEVDDYLILPDFVFYHSNDMLIFKKQEKKKKAWDFLEKKLSIRSKRGDVRSLDAAFAYDKDKPETPPSKRPKLLSSTSNDNNQSETNIMNNKEQHSSSAVHISPVPQVSLQTAPFVCTCKNNNTPNNNEVHQENAALTLNNAENSCTKSPFPKSINQVLMDDQVCKNDNDDNERDHDDAVAASKTNQCAKVSSSCISANTTTTEKEANAHIDASLSVQDDKLDENDASFSEKSKQGFHDKAEIINNECIMQLRKNALGPTHPDTLKSINNLATVYYKQGEYVKAEELYNECLQLRRDTLGPTHPDTLTSISNMASMYHNHEQHKKSKVLLKECLQGCKEVLGDDNHKTVRRLFHKLQN